ncbi:lipopolysaccharide biosynthesis protein [Anabaena azotica]|uniref:Polysaccharide biosynthesis protein n=1 Tax=Anabaena azotica FACHB-119 TaxID=947527 RepID=A0ABR8DBT9_9NOST|nr:polysaccharide biosynthesis protein [Anabaena azotica]MBD2503662.1 polysaccharide biosynthesis protein [Anabaena azotica FACHB-119]
MSLPFLPSNVAYWIKVLSKFVSAQILVQALTIASGIFIVRTLDQQQYAYYTIANSMLSTMNILADSGIGTSLAAIGGKVWQDRYRFGQLINTAMRLRYFLAAISISVVTPILIWMLIRNGASIISAIFISIIVLIGLNFQITNGVLIVVPHLHSQISLVQNLDIFSAILKIVLLGLGYLTYWNATIAIAFASLISGLQRFILGQWVKENIDTKAPINEEQQKYILTTIKHSLPNSIFFCVQVQLSVFLISIFGTTQNVAELGALGRIGVIFTIINSVMTAIVLPSFSRCQSVVTLRRRYFQILGFFLLFATFIILIIYIFPEQILWVIGKKYSYLKNELFMIAVVTVVNSLLSMMTSLNLAKGWVEYAWVDIPMKLFLQIFLLMNLDISSIKGVVIFSLLSQISSFLVSLMITYRGFSNYNKI